MRETVFVNVNQGRWQEFERILAGTDRPSPDTLEDMFIQLTDDLSFARTQFEDSRTTRYLNQLTGRIHQAIYRNKREEKKRFASFWKTELPMELFARRSMLLYALIIFAASTILGVFSTLHDETFVRLILGDQYVNMTLENIRNGEPLAVYGSQDMGTMFLLITFNNIKVSFLTFAMGIFFSVGTGIMLFQNGLMLGAFMTLFFQHGLLGYSASIVLLHGTIELSSIIVAGAAGLMMGNSILFPGTYTRLAAFQCNALAGAKIVGGLVPFFIIAGFIESFITRYGHMPLGLRIAIIGCSAALVVGYFIIYPHLISRHGTSTDH